MTNRKAVCFLTGTLNAFAGAERMTAVIANGLAEQGHDIHVISLWDPQSCFALHAGVRHHALHATRPSFKREFVSTVRALRAYFKQHRIGTLVEADTMLAWFTLPATLGLPVRRIAWEHCHFDEDLGRPLRRVARQIAARTHAAVVVLTERDRQRWLEATRPRARVVVIPNALAFPYPAQPATRHQRTVLAVGRLTHAKGFDVLLDAWATVRQRHPQWHLVIAGSGEERAALASRVHALDMADAVTLREAQTDVQSLYANAGIFCLSSRYEGFGLVLIEAMSYGLPVASTYCETGPRELLHPDVDALTFPSENAPAMADALCRLIEDTSLADRLAGGARETARGFALDVTLARWQPLLG
ncbi:glycosyltransferase family 4 protein [Cupriavidus campinensis]|uniref:Glycosyltransferase family 4 protein n=1 Tax=Cupriavidus campinensis TaxID=151783 RepID=A0AAE9L1L0_9BURK|nr:glycosyltransferase family 4 protein [Cupriavidus campinensis]URF03404.1 glycosyltransferase family 4 protein [Cupriavidus campinensis]